jgi:small subunit ribosomal protein S5
MVTKRRVQSNDQPKSEFVEQVVQLNRTSKKTSGGNTMSFSAMVVVGDKKGRVGVGLGKAPEVSEAIRKGVTKAKKQFLTVPIYKSTIPHPIEVKLGAARVLLKPAPEGTGVIAGGAVRAVVEAAGINNILSKVLGTNNKISNVYATMEALRQLRARQEAPVAVKKVKEKEVTHGTV